MSKSQSKKIPMRRCVGCMESKPKKELLRTAQNNGEFVIDPDGKGTGRGIYICKNKDCLDKAVKKRAFQRNLNIEINEEDKEKLYLFISENNETNDKGDRNI